MGAASQMGSHSLLEKTWACSSMLGSLCNESLVAACPEGHPYWPQLLVASLDLPDDMAKCRVLP